MDKKRILIVDDEEPLRSVLQELMVFLGHEAKTAANAHEALDTMATETFDLVLVDLHMPGMEGLELIKLVKKDHPDIDFIAITAYHADYRYADVIEVGASDFITKPFENFEIEAKINRVFRERQLKKELERISGMVQPTGGIQPLPRKRASLYKSIADVSIVLAALGFLVLGYLVQPDKNSQVSPPSAGITWPVPSADGVQPAQSGNRNPGAGSIIPTPAPAISTVKVATDALIYSANNQLKSNPVAAQVLLEKAIAIDPNNFQAIFQLARILTFKRDFAAAVQQYQNALRLNDKVPDIYFNLGYIYMCQGFYDQAIVNYEKCGSLSPSYKDELLTNLGICHLKKHNSAQAQLLFKQALDFNPNNELARGYLKSKGFSS
jgi:CheY-like chemotaxis protein